jgi:hypothetical protein
VARKAKGKPKQGPPFQFRAGVDLEGRIRSFAVEHGLQPNEACKVLATLAVTEMDRRFYKALRRMSEALGGQNAFVRSCVHVQAALEGARRGTGRPMQFDPERTFFLLNTVNAFLAERNQQLEADDLWFTADTSTQTSDEAEPESVATPRPQQPLQN